MFGSVDAVTQARKALELALRVGDVLLTAGMSANDVAVEMLRITEAYGLNRVHLDVTFTSIAVTYYAAPTSVPMTLVRTVQPDVLDFTRVRRVQALVREIHAGLPLQFRCHHRRAPIPHPWLCPDRSGDPAACSRFIALHGTATSGRDTRPARRSGSQRRHVAAGLGGCRGYCCRGNAGHFVRSRSNSGAFEIYPHHDRDRSAGNPSKRASEP